MSDFSTAIGISCELNATRPRPVYIEPWGEDYWLFPGDTFEIVALGRQAAPRLEIFESDEDTEIYLEHECHDFAVYQNGHRLECGYQRARLAGCATHAFNIISRGIVITSDKPWQTRLNIGDRLRLLIPKAKSISAEIVGIEHLNGGGTTLENPWGLLLGELEIKPDYIAPGTPVYRLDPEPE